jgi:hypothetical protein
MKTAAIATALCLLAPLACEPEDPPASAGAEPEAPVAKSDDAPPPSKSDAAPAKPEPAAPSSPSLIGKLEEARVKSACNELQMLRSAVEMFAVMKGGCPPDLATLETERIIDRLRDDPWGHAYRLRCSELELRSDGRDGEPGTPDDVVLGATGDACTPK